ncbi:MAG: hypothetical protein QM757_47030 [Paludibaculum sp.]
MARTAAVQKPAAECRSKLMRRQLRRKSMVRALVQRATPGHQMNKPEIQRRKSRSPPTPFTVRPVRPEKRLKWRSCSQRMSEVEGVVEPTSWAVTGWK